MNDVDVVGEVVGRTGPKVRLRIAERFAGNIGATVLVVAQIEDDTETVAATVIGRPSAQIIEIEMRGELFFQTKTLTLRR